jgi:two-component system, sensor histidine kinase and response regulator
MDGNTDESRVNILIVDDHDENIIAFRSILEDLGQNIVTAQSGEEALRLLYNEDYAVILLDVRMPIMDGFETASFIRARPRSHHIPIIFVTAFDDTLDRISKGYSIGAVDYIMKPVNADFLRSKVKVFIELSLKTKSLEREVRERQRVEDELRSSNRELEAFSYSVSHDLRTPLRAINGFSEILADSYQQKPLDQQGHHCLRQISKNAKQMNDLIEDLLTFSRMGREKVEMSALDPAEVLTQSLALLNLAEAETRIEKKFPSVLGNRVLLGQVFANLIGNAVKFVAGGTHPVVTVRGETSGDRVRIWVEDNGIGIDPSLHDRLFRVFERLNPEAGYPGTGIGLAIVKRAMDRMGGKVGLESAVAKGCRFWIELRRPRAMGRSEQSFSAETENSNSSSK